MRYTPVAMRSLAVYPGSFDPPTLGHLDIVERGAQLFDRLVVAVGRNSSKEPFLSAEERVGVLRDSCAHLPNVEVEPFDGLLVDYVRSKGAHSIVRGLRAVADFEYEFQIAMVNRKIAPEIDSVFLMTHWDYSYLSSSVVREVARLGGDVTALVPPATIAALARRMGQKPPE